MSASAVNCENFIFAILLFYSLIIKSALFSVNIKSTPFSNIMKLVIGAPPVPGALGIASIAFAFPNIVGAIYLNANMSAALVPEFNTLITCKGTYELLATFFNTTGFSLAAGITVKSPAVPTNKLKPS